MTQVQRHVGTARRGRHRGQRTRIHERPAQRRTHHGRALCRRRRTGHGRRPEHSVIPHPNGRRIMRFRPVTIETQAPRKNRGSHTFIAEVAHAGRSIPSVAVATAVVATAVVAVTEDRPRAHQVVVFVFENVAVVNVCRRQLGATARNRRDRTRRRSEFLNDDPGHRLRIGLERVLAGPCFVRVRRNRWTGGPVQ